MVHITFSQNAVIIKSLKGYLMFVDYYALIMKPGLDICMCSSRMRNVMYDRQ